jgi:aminopeptidase
MGPPASADLVGLAAAHLRDILALAVQHDAGRKALIVADSASDLSRLMAAAWRAALPTAGFLDFDAVAPADVLAALAVLGAGDLAVLVQSTSFRLEAFRIRVELFKRGLKVIEHPHLGRMDGEQMARYVDSLAYDPAYYRGVGAALKARIEAAGICEVDSGGEVLAFRGPFEEAKLNTGDYRGMRNVGGQFPIGEVFTEAKDLEGVAGRMRILAFANTAFEVEIPERPATLVIDRGRVVGAEDAPEELERVLARIRADEGEVWVRELGFGMNRAFSPGRVVVDIGTLERMCGIHVSLGAKHAVYPKPGFSRRAGRHHVDVFAATESVRLDGETVFRAGAWTVGG